MKIRLTRKGDAFAISKPDKGAGLEDDEAEDAPQSTSAAAGMDQDMPDVESSPATKERSPDSDSKRRRLSSPSPDNNGNVEGPTNLKGSNGAVAEASPAQEETEAATEVTDAKDDMLGPSEHPKVASSTEGVKGGMVESKLSQSPATSMSPATPMDVSPVKTAPTPVTASEHHTVPVPSPAPLPPKAPPAAEPLNRELYRIPSYAAWFSWNKIHNLERRALSVFFDGKSASKTPKIYKEYRDFMINKYRENSQRRLTFTEVRKMLVGDVNTLQKVFDFLEHWGLINNQVSADPRKQTQGVIAVEPGPASMRVYPEVRTAGSQHPDGRGGTAAHSYPSLASHRDILGSAGAQKTPTRYLCTVCKADCSKERYQRQGQAVFVLCPNCLKGEKYGPGLSASDFTLITAETKEDWTQQETLLLLEGITRYGDNWNRVADHVGTKSKGECVMHFIGLPFGDRLLGDVEVDNVPYVNGENHVKPVSTSPGATKTNQQLLTKSGVGKGPPEGDVAFGNNTGSSLQLKEDSISPLLDASNPLMGQVAFLASMVGPRVAAAAALAAVAAITEEEATVPIFSFSTHAFPSDAASLQPNSSSAKEASDLDSRLKEETTVQSGQNGNNSLVQEPPAAPENANTLNMALPSAVPARMAIATALGVAAANAKLLADQEEREIESLLADIIDNQFKKLQSKLEHFEELEMLLERERIEVERARTQVYADRIRFAEFQFGSSRIPNGEVRQTDNLHSTRPATSPGPPRALPGLASKLIPTRKI